MATPGPESSSPMSSPLLRIILLTALLVPLATGVLLSWHSMGALDIWLHHQVGQDILSGDGFPRTNTYSYSEPQHPWTNHEWLFQVLVGLIGPDQSDSILAGIDRWNLLRTILAGVLMVVLLAGDGNWSTIRRKENTNWGRCWQALPLLGGLLLLWPRLILRPEMVSYIFFVFLVRILDRPLNQLTPGGDWRDLVYPGRPLGLAFWITVAWSQFHGFSSLAPLILALALLSSWLEMKLPGRGLAGGPLKGRWWLLAPPLLLAGLCLSPNGIQGLLYPLRALGQFQATEVDLMGTISELVPLLDTRDSLGLTIRGFQWSLVWGLIWILLTWGQTSLLRIMLWVGAGLAAYFGQRNIGFYGIAFILLHSGTRGISWRIELPAVFRKVAGPTAGFSALAVALLVAIPWWVHILGDDFYLAEGVSRRFGSGATVGRYPEHTAELLAETPSLPLFTNVDAAAFLLDRGRVRLFIDGRTEAYSSQQWSTYVTIKRGGKPALSALQNSRAEGVFLSTGGGGFQSLTRTLLQDPQWFLSHYDETGFFFLPRRQGGDVPPTPPQEASLTLLEGTLPADDILTPIRAADLCLAWSIVMEIGEKFTLQEKALRRGLEFRPDHPGLQHNLGNILLARGDNDGALSLFNGALQVNPRLAGSALNAGVCQLRLGDAEKAREMFARAASINPKSFQAWANLSTACQALRDRDGALQALEKAAALQPENLQIQSMLKQLRTSS